MISLEDVFSWTQPSSLRDFGSGKCGNGNPNFVACRSTVENWGFAFPSEITGEKARTLRFFFVFSSWRRIPDENLPQHFKHRVTRDFPCYWPSFRGLRMNCQGQVSWVFLSGDATPRKKTCSNMQHYHDSPFC
jgi:hypothetical protein